MESEEALRRHERLSVGPEYGVRMFFQGREIESCELQNLSACGCGVKVPRSGAMGMETGLTVETLYMIHPGLPCVPFQATIVRLLGKATGGGAGYILLGLDFGFVSPTVVRLIGSHVLEQMGGRRG